MNRLDYALLFGRGGKGARHAGGNFEALYGGDPKALEQARYVAAVALVAADRLYSRITKQEFELREKDEHF